jgi:histidine triad (HIT) family protein
MTYDKNNIFAKIIRGEVPANKVFEDDDVLAFHDISKAAPIHILVIPKGEFVDFGDFASNESPSKVASFFKKAAKIAKMLDLENSGYRIISNIGADASQTVKHFHIHILGKKKLGALVVGDSTH